MEKLKNPAILVVDMLNDFVTGALTCDRAKAIVPATAELLDAARKAGVPVIFCNDAHIAGIDRELKLWGDHAIAGTEGAEVIPELKLSDKDYVVPKRHPAARARGADRGHDGPARPHVRAPHLGRRLQPRI